MRCDCPGCGIRMDVADDLPAAKRIRCPECGDRFFLDDIEEARPARRRSRSPRRRQTMNLALIAVPIAFGLLLLVGAGVLAIIYWPAQEKKPESAGVPSGGQPGPLPFRPLLQPQPRPQIAPQTPRVGDVAKEIQGEDIGGQRFKLSDYRGKVVVLDFWGNW